MTETGCCFFTERRELASVFDSGDIKTLEIHRAAHSSLKAEPASTPASLRKDATVEHVRAIILDCKPGTMGDWTARIRILEINGLPTPERTVVVGMFDPEPGKEVCGFIGWTNSIPCSLQVLHENAMEQ